MTRSGFSPRWVAVSLAAMLVAGLLAPTTDAFAESAPSGERGVLRVHATALTADGRVYTATRVFTASEERSWESFEATDWVTVGSRVSNTSSWRSRSKVNYGTTELARENPGKRLMKKGAALVNKNRGTANAPSHKIKNTRHDIIPENQFPSRNAYLSQFHQDSRSTIIMDPLDEFVDFVPLALGGFTDADVFSVRYEYATVQNVATPEDPNEAIERWEGAFWIQEGDIYVRSDAFERHQGFDLNNLLVFGYMTISGYEQTGWTDDALGFVNPHADEAAFDNRQSDMWKQHQERDRFYYENVRTTATNAAMEMLPLPGTVIDIGGNISWINGLEPPLGFGPAFIQSKPSAFNGSRKAVTKIFRIDPGPPERLRRITTLRNNLENWPRVDQGIPEPWYPLVRFNTIRIANQRNLDQLVKAIEDHCVPMTLRGLNFTCVLPVRVRHQAYVSENGGKQTINQDYYLMDSSALRAAP